MERVGGRHGRQGRQERGGRRGRMRIGRRGCKFRHERVKKKRKEVRDAWE